MNYTDAVTKACDMSRKDGCDRYLTITLAIHQGAFVVDQQGYRITDWLDDACVVRIDGRGEAESIISRRI